MYSGQNLKSNIWVKFNINASWGCNLLRPLGKAINLKIKTNLQPIWRPVELGDGVLLGSDRHDGSSNGLQEDKNVRGEVVVGVLEHQVTRQRAHVTNAGVGNLQADDQSVKTKLFLRKGCILIKDRAKNNVALLQWLKVNA